MNTVLLKRFLKYNRTLVAVIGASLLFILFMLVVSVIEYLKMVEANTQVDNLRNKISELQDPMRNEVAVIAGNLDRLKEDYQVYREKNAVLRPYIGQPYRHALDKMAQSIGLANGDVLVKQIYDFLNENRDELLNNRFTRFTMEQERKGVKWAKAMEIFKEEAQKVSFEKINDSNINDIFMQAIGLRRTMFGRSVDHCQNILKETQINLNKFVMDRNVDINQGAADFALFTPGIDTPDKIAESMENMEIVGDMIRRIIANVPADRNVKYLRCLDAVQYRGKTAYREDSKIEVYKYTIKFVGTMQALREIVTSLNNSVNDSRIYVVRNIEMSIPLKDDPAAVVIGLTEAPVMLDKDGKKIEIIFKDDSHLSYEKRRDYGKVLVGKEPFFEAALDLEYMILKQYDYQNR